MEGLGFSRDKYIFASVPSVVLVGDSAENNRNKQIALFLNELNTYGVLLKDLVNYPLKENDRNVALNIAYYITNNEELINIINRKRDLPISRISKLIRIKQEYLEKCREYILSYYIILSNPNYKGMQDYFRIILKEDNNITSFVNKKQEAYEGIVVKVWRKSAFILTSKGEFIRIRINNKPKIGDICEGKEKKKLRNFKIHISILLFILILIGSGIIIEYRRTQTIIVIETTSVIKLHINKFNKVIYAYSPTEKGKELVKNIDVLNKDIDEAVEETFEYAYDNEMLDINKEIPALSKKTLITVTGQAIKYGALTKTNKFITEKKIPIVINNAGNQQKLPKYILEDEEKTEK